MIDEKKLIEKLYEYVGGDFSIIDIEYLEKIIENQPKVNEWIPCSEKPEKEGAYLVAWLPAYKDEKGEIFAIPCRYPHYFILANYYEDEEEWHFDLPFGYDEAILLAWMPLPEPYKG